jgi:hypothetical protein
LKGAIARLYLRPSTTGIGDWFDLCPKCVKSLQEWLEYPKLSKEIENKIYSQCCVPKGLVTGMSDPFEEGGL